MLRIAVMHALRVQRHCNSGGGCCPGHCCVVFCFFVCLCSVVSICWARVGLITFLKVVCEAEKRLAVCFCISFIKRCCCVATANNCGSELCGPISQKQSEAEPCHTLNWLETHMSAPRRLISAFFSLQQTILHHYYTLCGRKFHQQVGESAH